MSDNPSRGYIGRKVARKEDFRLLTGRGTYVADLQLPNMLHAAFVRSPMAHARLDSVDVTPALSLPGVIAAFRGADLVEAIRPLPDHQVSVPKKWQQAVAHNLIAPGPLVLPVDKVRHVGEALAVVVAKDRYIAEDAAELVAVDYGTLPVVADSISGMQPGAPLVHEHLGTNVIGQYAVVKGDVQAALQSAPRTLKRQFKHHRQAAMPMECRGAAADYDQRTDSLTVWCSTQMAHLVRRMVASLLGMPEARVRCIAPDVGGGFGSKGQVYPEEIIVAYLARTLRRPVKWVEDRREHFVGTVQARDQAHETEVAFDETGRILALDDRFVVDGGAWNPLGLVTSYNTASHMMGPYKIPNFRVNATIVATNKAPNAPYRGAGRPEAVFVMERVMDLVARELNLDPVAVRLRNMVQAEEMPYHAGIVYRDGSPVIYDSGDFPAALHGALEALGGLEAFRRRQQAAWEQGRYLGLGLGCYTEGTGVGSFEGALVRVDPSGKIYVATGATPHGQGHETAFSQVAADCWGVTPDDVVVTAGDTAAIPYGLGTIASRSAVVVSTAIYEASIRVQKKALAIAANVLECDPDDLEWQDGRAQVKGVPERSLSLKEVANAARPGWDHGRPAGMQPVLEETYYHEPETVTWAYATHAAVVEVDPATGEVHIEKFVVSHDAGTVINPLIAEGQIYGGVAQGIGGALLEELIYDENGQLLTGSFMDYLMPSATEIPPMQLVHQHFPSPLNPLGVKGLGEGGAIAPPVAIANAVCDALRPLGVEWNALPVRPDRIMEHFLAKGPNEGVQR